MDSTAQNIARFEDYLERYPEENSALLKVGNRGLADAIALGALLDYRAYLTEYQDYLLQETMKNSEQLQQCYFKRLAIVNGLDAH